MSINFIPLREQMMKEIELCVSLSHLETLLSFCNSCIFKLYENGINTECRTCHVHEGAVRIIRKAQGGSCGEPLGVC